ncbi:hypothetical protein [Streptomyces sp. IMTB 2501]|nr:hypothetical protein [Streptomyces sp. IMTB 2501]
MSEITDVRGDATVPSVKGTEVIAHVGPPAGSRLARHAWQNAGSR